jgi:hypothetical protein
LLASTPARNSDLWLHLASGRLLAQGRFSWGTDPFASTTAGVFWVNHAWLSDVVLYELYELGGGRLLVVTKCVLVTLLAALFFGFRRKGTRAGILAFAAAGAVLALGPWLLLQPTLLSLLGVALTLYLLERPSLLEDSRAGRARAQRWLLVPLFALWANLDAWFLLGPVLVGLYALGDVLPWPKSEIRNPKSEIPTTDFGFRISDFRFSSLLLALAGLAACLLTPYHYHIFAWPTPLGLSHAEQVLMADPIGEGLVVSPFGRRFTAAPAFVSPGGWAYCVLLTAGAASFALCGRALHPGRLLAWLALAALSLYQARAIPFFAVAAGPMMALNLQEWVRFKQTRKQTESEIRNPKSEIRNPESAVWILDFGFRIFFVCLLVCLLVLAWPGWLQPAAYQPRAWAVDPDGSMVRLAQQLANLHADLKVRATGFAMTFSPEAAHYLAWFCPAEKGFLDSRWTLFDRVADDFVRIRRCLLQPEGPGPDPQLGPLLDSYHVDRILLYDPDWGRTTLAYRSLLLSGKEWDLLDLEGTAVLFGRRSGAGPASPWKGFDLRRAAYRPGPDRQAPGTAPRAPRPPGRLDPFYRARDARSADRGEAAMMLLTFDLMAQRMQADLDEQWLLAQAAGLVGSGLGSEPAGTAGALAVRLYLTPLPGIGRRESGVGIREQATPTGSTSPTPDSRLPTPSEQFAAGFLALRDRGPPEALLLAVRAARRALYANPEDAGAFLLLGNAYLRLARQTREQGWQVALPELATVRRVQALTALEQAVLLRPDLDEAHAVLAQFYSEGGQLDRTLDHLQARLRIAGQEAQKRGPDASSAAERQATLEADVKAVEALVRRAEDIYEANMEGTTGPSAVLDRARLAARHGLSRKALELLLESHPAIFGRAGAVMQLDLMLGAGRAFEVRAWLEPEHEAVLGFTPYHTFQALAAAACGDYRAADAELDKLGEPLRQVQISADQVVPVRSAVALRVAGAVLARPAAGSGPEGLAGMAFRQFDELGPLAGPAALMRQEADLWVLRGLLALESGAVANARAHFRAALDVWGSQSRAASGAGLDFAARPIAEQATSLLEGPGS